jgi:nicotinamide-nucleotide amidase
MYNFTEELKKIHVFFIKHKLSIATAESCTGGFISKSITDLSNSSKYYKGSIIAYSNEVKVDILGIPEKIINNYGAVSEQVSVEMACGLLKILKSDFALSVTGIMEKNDDYSCKEPQVFLTIKSLHYQTTYFQDLFGSRDDNRKKTVYFAFNCLYDFINKNYLLS